MLGQLHRNRRLTSIAIDPNLHDFTRLLVVEDMIKLVVASDRLAVYREYNVADLLERRTAPKRLRYGGPAQPGCRAACAPVHIRDQHPLAHRQVKGLNYVRGERHRGHAQPWSWDIALGYQRRNGFLREIHRYSEADSDRSRLLRSRSRIYHRVDADHLAAVVQKRSS